MGLLELLVAGVGNEVGMEIEMGSGDLLSLVFEVGPILEALEMRSLSFAVPLVVVSSTLTPSPEGIVSNLSHSYMPCGLCYHSSSSISHLRVVR